MLYLGGCHGVARDFDWQRAPAAVAAAGLRRMLHRRPALPCESQFLQHTHTHTLISISTEMQFKAMLNC